MPDLELTQIDARPPLRPGLASASALLHAGLALAVIVVPILSGSSLPPPASGVQVFFAEPMVIAPPPPPPPPAPRALQKRAAPPPPSPALTAPVETPEKVVPEEAIEPSAPGGEPGGVEGGAPGGVVGAVVGGLPEEPAPPPPPVRVGAGIREPKKLKNVDPVYPEIAARAMVQGNVVVELELSPQGRVTDARVLSGNPLLSDAALAAVRQWIYTPTLKDGVPVRVIMTVTVHFKIS